jgi:hypothetical protein
VEQLLARLRQAKQELRKDLKKVKKEKSMPDEEDEVENLFMAARTDLRIQAYETLKDLGLETHEITLEIAEEHLKVAEKKEAIKYWQPPSTPKAQPSTSAAQGRGNSKGKGGERTPGVSPIGKGGTSGGDQSQTDKALAAFAKSKGLQPKDVKVEDLASSGGVAHWAAQGAKPRGSGGKGKGDVNGKPFEGSLPSPLPKQFNMQVQGDHSDWNPVDFGLPTTRHN